MWVEALSSTAGVGDDVEAQKLRMQQMCWGRKCALAVGVFIATVIVPVVLGFTRNGSA